MHKMHEKCSLKPRPRVGHVEEASLEPDGLAMGVQRWDDPVAIDMYHDVRLFATLLEKFDVNQSRLGGQHGVENGWLPREDVFHVVNVSNMVCHREVGDETWLKTGV